MEFLNYLHNIDQYCKSKPCQNWQFSISLLWFWGCSGCLHHPLQR